MAKVLRLYNTFTRSLNEVQLQGKLVVGSSTVNNNLVNNLQPSLKGSFYICGPTVYDDCHLGHALTYIRADLFRRIMRSIFNVRLQTVMNITDIDDKILDRASRLSGEDYDKVHNDHQHQTSSSGSSSSSSSSSSSRSRSSSGSPGALDRISSEPSEHPFNRISDRYFANFLTDMALIRVQEPDVYVKVSKHVDLVTEFIDKLEKNGNVYIANNGDIHFSVNTLQNYVGRIDPRKQKQQDNFFNISNTINNHNVNQKSMDNPSEEILCDNNQLDAVVENEGNSDIAADQTYNKQQQYFIRKDNKFDVRDFVLWKAAKKNEPVWYYQSSTSEGLKIPGRPGWHIQCSAIASSIFGNKLDFHFGGKDLIFPHHYNEQACSCAYHQLNTSKSLNVWTKHWLHSGHLIHKNSQTKMSKSLGNVLSIKDFLRQQKQSQQQPTTTTTTTPVVVRCSNPVNLLRLICISKHYRTDLIYDESLLKELYSLDHKLKAFNSYLDEELRLRQVSIKPRSSSGHDEYDEDHDDDYAADDMDDFEVRKQLKITQEQIVDGACDDLDLEKGLNSLLELAKLIYAKNMRQLKTRTILDTACLLHDWCNTCGLTYGRCSSPSLEFDSERSELTDGFTDESGGKMTLDLLVEFRNKVRALALKEMKKMNGGVDKSTTTGNTDNTKKSMQEILKECDRVRSKLNELGFVSRDEKSTTSRE